MYLILCKYYIMNNHSIRDIRITHNGHNNNMATKYIYDWIYITVKKCRYAF